MKGFGQVQRVRDTPTLEAATPVTATVGPITDGDLVAVGTFLQANLNARIDPMAWATALTVPWSVEAPNHGYLLRDGRSIVGAYLAYYSDRVVSGETARFCNLGAWCVRDEYRAQGIRLLRALLAQKEFHFTDLSPSGNVVALNQRLRFEVLNTTTTLLPNLPWMSSAARVTGRPADLERELREPELQLYRDHRRTAAARHLLISAGAEQCYLLWRRDRRKGQPLFASVLYVSRPSLYRRYARVVGSHLLVRHGIPLTLVEQRVAGGHLSGGRTLAISRPKMFRSPTLRASDIDYLYSELTCLAW